MREHKVVKVGMREFRAHLQHYMRTASPVAVTRHGETVGFYIPTHHHPEKAELDALKQAALKLESMLMSRSITEEDLLSEFRALKKQAKKHVESQHRTRR